MTRSRLSNEDLDFAIKFTRKFVMDRVRAFDCKRLEQELLSDLTMRAWKAWESFDPAAGKEWRYWLLDQLRYAFKDSLRKHNGTRNQGRMEFEEQFQVLSLSELEAVDATEEEPPPGMREAITDPIFGDWDQAERIEGLLDCLPENERQVVVQRFIVGDGRQEVAATIGCSSGTVRQLELQAMVRLRDAKSDPRGTPEAKPVRIPKPDLSRAKAGDTAAVEQMWILLWNGETGSAHWFATQCHDLFQDRQWPRGHGTYYSKMLAMLRYWEALGKVEKVGPKWQVKRP